MQVDQDRLKNENTSLVAAFREKSRKHQQTQELYDRLKRKEMTAATQSAAYQSADEVLGSTINRHGQELPYGQEPHYSGNTGFAEQGNGHRGNGSNGKEGTMPPPPRRGFALGGAQPFASCLSLTLHCPH